jgi:Dyp-type peroxidase family
MTVNLNAPLKWTSATPEQIRMLENLQGNILKGHGRHYTANIFFRFAPNDATLARRLVRDLANYHLTSAHAQLLKTKQYKSSGLPGGPFCHLALTFKAYAELGLPASAAPTDADFRAGMASPTSIAALKDPPLASWEAPFQQDIHGVLLAANDSESETAALTGQLLERLDEAGCTVVHIQRGKALFNAKRVGIENFGYVDGRSQPLMLVEDIAEEAASAGVSRWDPSFPLKTALIKDPGIADPESFGSLFVVRRLEQDVRGFKAREQQVADILGLTGDARELAGALIVGRFEDGTPVTLSDEAQALAPPNDFDYGGDAGRRCPFHAHIRKSNPRGSGGAEPEAQERQHLMARRGIPYEDVKRTVHPEELPEAETTADFNAEVAPLLPTGGVGLLFMAYNHDISQQFKFTQQTWVNNSGFPVGPPGPHGIDPVIGQGTNAAGDQKLPKKWDDPSAGTDNTAAFSGFVKMRGGEYFFSPSLSFCKTL